MTPTTSPTGAAANTSSTPPTTSVGSQSGTSALGSSASESTFLQLLVAQLQNQDPTQPQDGTQFVSELAQFSSVQQQLTMVQDLNSINSILSGDANQAAGSGASGGTGQTTTTPATTQP